MVIHPKVPKGYGHTSSVVAVHAPHWVKDSARILLLSWTSHSSHSCCSPSKFGERKTSVLCTFDLPQSKALAQFLSLIHLLCCWDEESLPCQRLVLLVSLKPFALWETLGEWPKDDSMGGVYQLLEVRTSWCHVSLLLHCWSLPHSWGFAVITTCLFCFFSLLMWLMGHIWSPLSLPVV